jgi:hypothetical protein
MLGRAEASAGASSTEAASAIGVVATRAVMFSFSLPQSFQQPDALSAARFDSCCSAVPKAEAARSTLHWNCLRFSLSA